MHSITHDKMGGDAAIVQVAAAAYYTPHHTAAACYSRHFTRFTHIPSRIATGSEAAIVPWGAGAGGGAPGGGGGAAKADGDPAAARRLGRRARLLPLHPKGAISRLRHD